MVRSAFIQKKVLDIYKSMDAISYPIQPEAVLQHIQQNCRVMSYRQVADITNCSIEDVAALCESRSGATHYDREHDRYLIMFNPEMNAGRIRWTLAHEIGHICSEHFDLLDQSKIAYTENRDFYSQLESEADYFAWNLLAPLPIMRIMGVESVEDTASIYGLSAQAAALHFDRYQKWCRSHIKTAWENCMIRELRHKYTN